MSFQSAGFPLFLAASVLFFHALPRKARPAALLGISYLFYGLWSVRFALLLATVTGISYAAALAIASARTPAGKKRALTLGLAASLGSLLLFKYTAPLAAWISSVLPSFGALLPPQALKIVAPIGISYYTFRIVGYVLDVYWEKIEPERDFIAYAAFTAFFPHILSGPIQRAGDFLDQVRSPRPMDEETLASGLRLILFGFFKKLVIADPLGIFVNRILDQPDAYLGHLVALASYGFVFQLYADFSGFTDIAIGSARLFGIQSPKNFDSPLYSPNIQVFWKKWHMSLTTWLADYVFMPLRMATRGWGQAGLLFSITVNTVAIGLWHGASWNFLAFGLLHALYLGVSVTTMGARNAWFAAHPRFSAVRRFTAPFMTFHLWTLGSLIWRADSLGSVADVLGNLFASAPSRSGIFFFGKQNLLLIVLAVVVMEILHLAQSRGKIRPWFLERPAAVRWAAYYAMAFWILFRGQFQTSSFIYFQF